MTLPKGERPEAEQLPCINCGRRLRVSYEKVWKRFEEPGHIWSEPWYTGKILGYGIVDRLFCSTACAMRYGVRAACAGVRFEQLDGKRAPQLRKTNRKEASDV